MKCSVDSCERKAKCKGMCGMHYSRFWRHGDASKVYRINMLPLLECSVEGCSNRADRSSGMCANHHRRLEKYGRLHTIKASPSERSYNNQGYACIVVDKKSKLEHIHIAEKALGKPLPKGAIVHHVNERKWDNRNKNLVVCPSQEYHLMLHRRMKELGISFDADY